MNAETLSGRTMRKFNRNQNRPNRADTGHGRGGRRTDAADEYVYIALRDNCRQRVELRDDRLPEASDAAQTRTRECADGEVELTPKRERSCGPPNSGVAHLNYWIIAREWLDPDESLGAHQVGATGWEGLTSSNGKSDM